MRLLNHAKSRLSKLREHFGHYRSIDFTVLALIFVAVGMLAVVLVTYIIATQTRLSSYATPIPLAQKEYKRGEMIQGYFRGQKLYDGRVIIERQLSCNDGYIEILVNYRDGSKNVKSILPAGKIDETTPRNIALVPDDVKPGASCIVTFRHTACVPYLFGCYEANYAYVSLPFTIEKLRVEPEKPSSDDATIPDDDEGLSPPAVNQNPEQSSNQSPSTPQSPPATVPVPEPSENAPERNALQRLLRNVNQTIHDLPLVGGIIGNEEE